MTQGLTGLKNPQSLNGLITLITFTFVFQEAGKNFHRLLQKLITDSTIIAKQDKCKGTGFQRPI